MKRLIEGTYQMIAFKCWRDIFFVVVCVENFTRQLSVRKIKGLQTLLFSKCNWYVWCLMSILFFEKYKISLPIYLVRKFTIKRMLQYLDCLRIEVTHHLKIACKAAFQKIVHLTSKAHEIWNTYFEIEFLPQPLILSSFQAIPTHQILMCSSKS